MCIFRSEKWAYFLLKCWVLGYTIHGSMQLWLLFDYFSATLWLFLATSWWVTLLPPFSNFIYFFAANCSFQLGPLHPIFFGNGLKPLWGCFGDAFGCFGVHWGRWGTNWGRFPDAMQSCLIYFFQIHNTYEIPISNNEIIRREQKPTDRSCLTLKNVFSTMKCFVKV